MKPPPFKYLRAGSVGDALAALAADDSAKVLAGGQSLVPLLNMRLARPSLLVDIGQIGELAGISDGDGLRIGAVTRYVDVERSEAVRDFSPLIGEALRHVGHVGIRSRGTFGGSVAHADPAAELPAVLLALDAHVHVAGRGGERVVPADEFFVSFYETAMEDDEILTAVHFPASAKGRRWGFAEVARRHGDFALVGAAVTVDAADDGTCREARVALLGVAEAAVRARGSEAALQGAALTDTDAIEEAARIAADGLSPRSDVHASSVYRAEVASTVVRRALEQAMSRGEG